MFSIYMIIGIPSTGSGGLIQTIQAFAGGHIVAGILGIVAIVGWTLQGLGLGFYYRQASGIDISGVAPQRLTLRANLDMEPPQHSWSHFRESKR